MERVRHELAGEIARFVEEAEAAGGSSSQGFEDDGAEGQFSVQNPIKMSDTAGLGIGSVIKYTVIGQDS